MNEIQTRYSAKIPDGNEQMKAASERLKSVEAKVSDADASAAEAAAAKARVKELMESQSKGWVEKFSQFFDYKNDLLLRMGAEFNRASESEKQKSKEAYAKADDLMPVYKKIEFPHGYNGDDADVLRRKVEKIVKEKFTRAENLRVTLPAEDCKEEKVVEWTDTTKTALQHRITRFMTTQAASKGADGKVYLHSVYLASDRKADGTWGCLYGHVMWSDWMAENNVHKEQPCGMDRRMKM